MFLSCVCSLAFTYYDPTKRGHNLKLLGPDIVQWGGDLPRAGVVVKSSECPSTPREDTFWRDIPGKLQRYGVSKRFEKGNIVFEKWPLYYQCVCVV